MMINNYPFNTEVSSQCDGENDNDNNKIGAHIRSFLIGNFCRVHFVLKALHAIYSLVVTKNPLR